jgi:3-hydroxy-9,10-secoandrosta-1,3,5(10)-triene-9,17-dione monooxygenase reductase component
VVNILAADQVSVSNHFARQQDDKFASVDYELDSNGVPTLKGCAAHFHCKTRYLYEGGDHTIIVGEVVQFESTGRDGLLFHQGRYSISEAHPMTAAN